MDTVNEITSKPSSTQENSLSEIEKTSETTKNRNDDSSWLIENNPTISTISNADPFENINEITKSQKDDSSWLIENNPTTSSQSDDVTPSLVPTISNGDPFGNLNEIAKSQKDESSLLIENNSTTPSQSNDAIAPQIPTVSNGNPFENTNAITSNKNDDSSWLIENNPTISSQAPTIFNDDDVTKNQNDDSSWLIENNPTTSSQFKDVTTSQVPTVSNGDPFGYINEITKNQNDDSSLLIENNPTTSFQSDDITKSQVPTISNSNPFENNEQFFILPPTAEEILADNSSNHQLGLSIIPSSDNKSSFDMFSNEQYSPLQAIIKKREEEIAAKDVEEKKKIEKLRQEAKSDLENWYNDRQRQMEQKRQTMKKEENDMHTKALEKSSKEACDWSKVIRLLDFTDGTQLTKSKRDLTRMKTCIFNAKRINDKKNNKK